MKQLAPPDIMLRRQEFMTGVQHTTGSEHIVMTQ